MTARGQQSITGLNPVLRYAWKRQMAVENFVYGSSAKVYVSGAARQGLRMVLGRDRRAMEVLILVSVGTVSA